MITKSKRSKAIELVTALQGHSSILIHKLSTRPLPMAKLEDIEEQVAMVKADIEELHSVVRSAIWRTRTAERRKPGIVEQMTNSGEIGTGSFASNK